MHDVSGKKIRKKTVKKQEHQESMKESECMTARDEMVRREEVKEGGAQNRMKA